MSFLNDQKTHEKNDMNGAFHISYKKGVYRLIKKDIRDPKQKGSDRTAELSACPVASYFAMLIITNVDSRTS
ncbi:hypothetical protein SAMN04488029_1134 [Reichenbachiella faecimaris]|uniref:Uncharacterized protein n=1 Tax=Reichenbachiella faecimaris TaxID=692418 RepID=A0A1W2G817_REIFA|nr:hypothetical protein [Reichenbachiella faecimaris]SMD32783.1 hypothetical protein SAMN04488029_1134 [Reichenbachiella faecimaris]